ncbi:phage tail tape measure protein [Dickeya dianthicola]|uniref:phage tail tape measure protein n=1 Tax=Dickeya dianthicola TaxID=204039 RepID=UPI001F61A44D|nr:phage tail tape measure protein [Dickeya dianthicola]MCI4186089.1 phage tail tape measure protein [Dickeya dianthicola]
MARNLQLALTLTAKDTGSQVLRKAMADAVTATKNAERASTELATTQQKASSTGIQASRALVSEFQRAANARETLGIRSERQIQREIQQTMAAYNRLTRSGMLSANDQRRAFAAMTEQLTRLRTELNGTANAMGKFERLRNVGSNAAAVVGGVATAAAVVSQPIKKAASYEYTLANMANTAYADRDIAGRKAGMGELDQLIRQSVKTGGGTKERAAETLDTLLASGTVEMDSAKALLPVLQKYSTATGTDSKDLAQIAIRLKQTFGISDKDIGKALNMAISAGQGGGFELKDMAKWLPQQLAFSSNVGMKGLDDFAVLLGLNQASAITAGTKDQAGNNAVNLLQKINSQDAANAAKKIKINGKGIDLPGSIAAARGKGMNALDAFVEIVDKVVQNNPQYKALQGKLATEKGAKRHETMESMAKILEGSAIGSMVADHEALTALIAYSNNKKYAKNIVENSNKQRGLQDGQTAGDMNFELISGTGEFKGQQLANASDFAQIDSVKPLTGVLGDVSDKLVKYANEYPGLTTAVAGATTGIKAMTGAAMVFAGLKFLSGGGVSAPPVPGPVPGSGTPTPTGGWMARFGGIGRLAGKVAAPVMVYQAAQDAPLVQVERGDAAARERLQKNNYKSDTERMKDALKAQPGALDAWDEVKAWWSKPSTIGQGTGGVTPSYLMQIPQPPVATPAPPQPITHVTRLEVDGRVLAEAVNEYNGTQAVRGSVGGGY